MLRKYDKEITKLLDTKPTGTKWKRALKTHKDMIVIIQHERLIHLLVTMTVAIIMFMTFLFIIAFKSSFLLFVGTPLLVLFIGYLIHYRFLENTTQRWQESTEEIRNKI